jgi:hypothetical protein
MTATASPATHDPAIIRRHLEASTAAYAEARRLGEIMREKGEAAALARRRAADARADLERAVRTSDRETAQERLGAAETALAAAEAAAARARQDYEAHGVKTQALGKLADSIREHCTRHGIAFEGYDPRRAVGIAITMERAKDAA